MPRPPKVSPTPIVIFEGLHPMHDERVNDALDLSIYIDITDSVKFAWKAQRDIAERGATMEEVQAAIDARKPDFAAYVEPQKAKADIVVQVIAIVMLCNDVRRGRLSTLLFSVREFSFTL